MNSGISVGSSGKRRLKAFAPVVGVMVAAAVGLGVSSAWAKPNSAGESVFGHEVLIAAGTDSNNRESGRAEQAISSGAGFSVGFTAVKADNPEQQPLFDALNQSMRQTMASYSYDIPKMQDPFLPIKAVRAGEEGKETDDCVGCGPGVSQMKLVAITVPSNGSAPLAAFEDGAGASHIFRAGDKIGRNNGRIVKITDSSVTVEEFGKNQRDRARVTEIKLRVMGTPVGLIRHGDDTQVQ